MTFLLYNLLHKCSRRLLVIKSVRNDLLVIKSALQMFRERWRVRCDEQSRPSSHQPFVPSLETCPRGICLSVCLVLSIYLSVGLSICLVFLAISTLSVCLILSACLHLFCLLKSCHLFVCLFSTLSVCLILSACLHLFCLLKSCHLLVCASNPISSCRSILVSLCLTCPEVFAPCPHSTCHGFVLYRLSAFSTFS
jgi:hypothetical protein